jgi:RNA polymerase sigma factor (sigma-70 family)
MHNQQNINQLTDNLFRQEAGKMVAVLTRIFGTENMETAEDVVQDSLLQAMHVWKLKGIPDNPSGWLYRVAKNKAIDIIRRNKHSEQYDFSDSERILLTSEYTMHTSIDNFWKEDLIRDDQLRMMFACCHPGISEENQITLMLKTLCGFSTAEIAHCFLSNEETIGKRLYRTKEFFKKNKIRPEIPTAENVEENIEPVLKAIYLLFNEGYNSSHAESIIREDLMLEALMLCKLLSENEKTRLPQVYALMALICFQSSRNKSRLSPEGEIILLPRQDRSQWNHALIHEGNEYLNKAAFGDRISSYHIEAAIAYEHCTAVSFATTNWKRILELFEWLCTIAPSPITELNKAVVLMQVHGPEKALANIEAIEDKKKLEVYYLYHAFLGELHTRMNHNDKARRHFETALQLTHADAEKKILMEKLEKL